MDESFSSTGTASFSSSRSPFNKDKAALKRDHIGSFLSSAGRFDASSAEATLETLVSGKIEHLEKERNDLSDKLQKQSELDREKKLRLKQLESELEESEKTKKALKEALETANELTTSLKIEKKIRTEQLEHQLEESDKAKQALKEALETANELLKTERGSFENEIKQMKEQHEQQASAAAESRSLWNRISTANRELRRIEEEATKLRREKVDMSSEKTVLAKTIDELKEKNEEYEKELICLKETKSQLETDFAQQKAYSELESSKLKQLLEETQAALMKVEAQMERQRLSFEYDQEQFTTEIKSLREQLATAKTKQAETAAALVAAQHAAGDGYDKGVDSERNLDGMASAEVLAVVKDLREKLLQSELKRKQLHNSLQELRGNIRVFVRCRPFLRGDGEESTAAIERDPNVGGCVRFHKDGTSVSLASSTRGNQVFTFDHVFRCETTQDQVYKEVSDLVQSVLDGYKVCIFSYGQTGSGKTHTMSGEKDGVSRGIIPRSVEQIIENTIRMREEGWEVVVTASMVEIYNEELRDLLVAGGGGTTNNNSSASGAAAASASGSSASATSGAAAPGGGAGDKDKNNSKLKISFLQGYVTVSGLTSVELDTSDLWSGMRHLDQLLDRASRSRMTACTAMNERSSRSHAIFMLDISAKHTKGGTLLRGGLRLCDLAGSERLDRTGTMNDAVRLKETVNINKSLSCLADVFVALSNKAQHIPYRNSKITMLLQDCLSGDGKALMFVNVSPTSASAQETLCSLRFANQVSQVELGKAQKNVLSLMPAQLAPPPPPPAAVAAAPMQASSRTSASTSAALGRSSRASIMPAPSTSTYRGSSDISASSAGGNFHATATASAVAIGGLVAVPEEEEDEESSPLFPPPPPTNTSAAAAANRYANVNENADPNLETSFTRSSTMKPFSNSSYSSNSFQQQQQQQQIFSASPSRIPPASSQVSALSKAPMRPSFTLKRPAGMLGTTAGVGALSQSTTTSLLSSQAVRPTSTLGAYASSSEVPGTGFPPAKRPRQSILITPAAGMGAGNGNGVGGNNNASGRGTWR